MKKIIITILKIVIYIFSLIFIAIILTTFDDFLIKDISFKLFVFVPVIIVAAASLLAMKKIKIRMFLAFLYFAILIVVWSFFTFVQSLGVNLNMYVYESTDHGFVEFEMPGKGRDLESLESSFNEYKSSIDNKDVELRRTFKQDWHHYFKWHDYLTHRRWKYKYMDGTRKPE